MNVGARGSQHVLQDLPNYSGTCLTQSTWNVIVQSGWGEYYTEHREIGNAPISVTYSPLFSESKAPGSPRSTNMNGTDMSAVLLIIISIRLKEDQATASTRASCEKVKLIEEASYRINESFSFLFCRTSKTASVYVMS